ncbi:hypothetical protein BDW22DRAFT_1351774 [Trametopsis cervina]|nr:hypothetical protein BDW22DRAFT_1351774 [Trametopsis cervina]
MQNILDSGASTTDIDKPAPSRPESIFCVIDGDGYSFSLTQFARGVEGGKESLARLQESIYRGLDMWDRKPRPELSIKVFLNKAGLWNLLKYKERREDLSEKTDEFLQGFCKYVPGCDVVDVGRGKEVVDNKVREEIRRAVTNRKYTHIIFGGCHDTGYIPFLETLMREHEDARKMLYLMPAYPIDFAYTALNLPQLKPLDSVFNRRKLGGQYFEREREADSRMSRREPFATRQQLQPWKAFASGLGGDLPSPVGSAFSTSLRRRESEPLTLDRSKVCYPCHHTDLHV